MRTIGVVILLLLTSGCAHRELTVSGEGPFAKWLGEKAIAATSDAKCPRYERRVSHTTQTNGQTHVYIHHECR